MRVALGASRARIARLLATETAVVAVAGGALGVVIAIVTFRAVTEIVPPDYRVFMPDAVNLRMLAFGGLGIAVAGVAFAVSAALAGARADLRATLERAGRGRGAFRAGGWLLGAQAAVAIVVIVGAVFMVTSFRRLASVDLGFEPEGLYRTALMGPIAGEPPDGLRARYDALMERLDGRKDFSVAASDSLPWTGEAPITGFSSQQRGRRPAGRVGGIPGRQPRATRQRPLANGGRIPRARADRRDQSRRRRGALARAARGRQDSLCAAIGGVPRSSASSTTSGAVTTLVPRPSSSSRSTSASAGARDSSCAHRSPPPS